MVDKSKRDFLTRYFPRQLREILAGFQEGMQDAEQKDDFDRYFETYGSSYALTLAYPDDILSETAHRHGIETEGREKNDIVKELFQKAGWS